MLRRFRAAPRLRTVFISQMEPIGKVEGTGNGEQMLGRTTTF